MGSPRWGNNKRKGSGSIDDLDDNNPNTVYGELKLSEKLSLEIIQLRKEKEIQKEEIEDLTIKKTILSKRSN